MPLSRALLTLLLCITLVVMRIGSAHLHLCMDGQAPAASIHFDDDAVSPAATHAEVGQAHQDYDVELGSNALGKLPKIDFTLLALLLTFALWLLPRRRPQSIAWQPALRTPYSPPHYLRPPPCGPPLNSLA